MRIRLKTLSSLLYLIPLLTLLILLVVRVLAFIHLFGAHAGLFITQAEIADSFSQRESNSGRNVTDARLPDQLIPKIIHQIFHNWKDPGNDAEETLPKDWATARKSCVDLHPGWEVKLWNEKESREFIAREYPTFLDTYDGYRFPVQRTDALRYFLLMHYGGIYMDLDNGCRSNLEPLLYYPTFVADGAQGALSNNILASRPNHPFWNLLTLSLRRYDYNYVLPYITISYASGQWFETEVWELYHSLLPSPSSLPWADSTEQQQAYENKLYRLKLDAREADNWTYFTAGRGGTWNNWDNRFFGWIGQHVLLVVLGAVAATALVVWGAIKCLRRMSRRGGGGGGARYRPLIGGGGGGGGGIWDEEETELEKYDDRP